MIGTTLRIGSCVIHQVLFKVLSRAHDTILLKKFGSFRNRYICGNYNYNYKNISFKTENFIIILNIVIILTNLNTQLIDYED